MIYYYRLFDYTYPHNCREVVASIEICFMYQGGDAGSYDTPRLDDEVDLVSITLYDLTFDATTQLTAKWLISHGHYDAVVNKLCGNIQRDLSDPWGDLYQFLAEEAENECR